MRNALTYSLLLVAGIVAVVVFWLVWMFNLWPQQSYQMEELGLKRLISSVDFNENGIDDYTEILNGARRDAENMPRYDGSYQEDGYPPEDVGVCTDLVWRAFREAGYNLREMVDSDIAEYQAEYGIVEPDSKIDFRRVRNLWTYFERYATKLSNDWQDYSEWQAGDIVILSNGTHIGIVSDKRNENGRPYIIHNEGQPVREEDFLKRDAVVAHYRFDASKIDQTKLVKWED